MMKEILETMAEQSKGLDVRIQESKKAIDMLKSAGEDTLKLEAELKKAEIKHKKWQKILSENGYL